MTTQRTIYILLCIGLVLAALLPGFYNALKVQRYRIDTLGIDAPVRIAQISDLHSCRYGEGMRELIDAVDAEAPDLIVLTGDIFDDDLPDTNAETFLRAVAGKYPCYYVTGNHEYWAGAAAFEEKMAILEDWGVRRLSGEAVTVAVNGQTFVLCGVDDPCADGECPKQSIWSSSIRPGHRRTTASIPFCSPTGPSFAKPMPNAASTWRCAATPTAASGASPAS